jgi:Ca2+/H+ antiporter
MVRKIMIVILMILVGYIFYAEFMADSLEPLFKKYSEKPLFYQVRVPKIADAE